MQLPETSYLLIDIDADYMLDRRLLPSGHRNRKADVWTSADRLFEALRSKGLDSVDRVKYCEDHSEAYRFWRSIKIKESVCIHIDAHSDIYGSRLDPNALLSLGYEPVAGNYLRFALAAGVTAEVFLVPPDWFSIADYYRTEFPSERYRNDGRIHVCHLQQLELPKRSCTVITIATSPRYTPEWLDCEAQELFRLFQSIQFGGANCA